MIDLTLDVNGEKRAVRAQPNATLLEVLRDGLDLTGTKYGCGEGRCGACAVLVDGRAMRACLMKATAAQGRRIVTIEGLAQAGRLHPVQQAFLDAGAFQCGSCTPGMIVGAVALLQRQPSPSANDVRQSLDGHICRCGAYPRIVEAVMAAGEVMRRG